MAGSILLDEFHLRVRAPRGLPEPDYDAMRQALDAPDFQASLCRAVRRVFCRGPALAQAHVSLRVCWRTGGAWRPGVHPGMYGDGHCSARSPWSRLLE
jgi:hypothetical protein